MFLRVPGRDESPGHFQCTAIPQRFENWPSAVAGSIFVKF